jgi:hypothetical protein
MRSRSFSTLLPQDPELQYQSGPFDFEINIPALETTAPAIHYHSSVRSYCPDSVSAVAKMKNQRMQRVEIYLLLVLEVEIW